MKKTLILAVALVSTFSLAASPLANWYMLNQKLLKQNPAVLKHDRKAKTTSMTGVKDTKWRIFRAANPITAAKGQNIEITLKASGKGNIDIGFYEYIKGYTSTGFTVKKIAIPGKLTEQKIIVPVKYTGTKIIRPAFEVLPDSQIVIHKIDFKVVK